jgi:hypothetical protein
LLSGVSWPSPETLFPGWFTFVFQWLQRRLTAVVLAFYDTLQHNERELSLSLE